MSFLTSEQLQSARAERWRQVSNPVLTAEDAQAWLERVGLCLFLPRRSHARGAAQAGLGFAPAPSLVEAVAGSASEAPTRDQVENATALLRRLTTQGAIAPLNLFGGNHFGAGGAATTGAATGAVMGPVMGVDTPDFVVTREALPYVFSLIGGRNWKSGPGGKASPLMTEIWTLLNDGESRTAQEIQAALGRELTEAAVLRALVELWNGLRAIPVYGEETRWELTQAKFASEMTASQKVAQVTALSALVSLYLEAVVAASSEDVETFLSPLASRSRVREVVNGLLATRQLALVSIGAQPLVHLAGMLPEFAPAPAGEAKPAEERREPARAATFENRRPFEQRPPREQGKDFRREKREERRPFEGGRERRALERGGREKGRAGRPFEPGKRASADRGGRRGVRPEDRGQRSERPMDRPERDKQRPYRKPFDRERTGDGGERRFGDRERRPFGKKPFGKKPFGKDFGPRRFEEGRPGGERREGGKLPPKRLSKGDESSWRERSERKESGKPSHGGRRFESRGEERGAGRRFGPREPGEEGFRKSGFGKSAPGPSRRPGKPFGKTGKPFGKSGKPGFDRPKRAGKPGGFKPPFRKRKKDEGGGE